MCTSVLYGQICVRLRLIHLRKSNWGSLFVSSSGWRLTLSKSFPHQGTRSVLCHTRTKTQGPRWAGRGQNLETDFFFESTKKSITCRGVWGPAMVLCYFGDLGVRDQGHCQMKREWSLSWPEKKHKQFSEGWKWALTSWWGLNVMCYWVSRSWRLWEIC